MGSHDVLPDCRTRERTGLVATARGNMVPIYCGSCGKIDGYVDEKYCTHAFALCVPCSEKYGDIAHFYKEPDEVFWARIREAEAAEEVPSDLILLAKELEDPSSIASKLAEDWRRHVLKGER